MNKEDELLFKKFIDDDIYNNDITYEFIMKTGDVLIVKYDGEGEFEINPITNEFEDYYVFVFYIIKIKKNISNKYSEDGFLVTSKFDFPVSINIINI